MKTTSPPDLGGCVLTVQVPALRGEQPARINYLVVETDLFKAQEIAERHLGSASTIESIVYIANSELPSGITPGAILVWS